MPFCRAYGDVLVAALASQMAATVRGFARVLCDVGGQRRADLRQHLRVRHGDEAGSAACASAANSKAQIDLQLFEGSLKSLGEEGPESERGRRCVSLERWPLELSQVGEIRGAQQWQPTCRE